MFVFVPGMISELSTNATHDLPETVTTSPARYCPLSLQRPLFVISVVQSFLVRFIATHMYRKTPPFGGVLLTLYSNVGLSMIMHRRSTRSRDCWGRCRSGRTYLRSPSSPHHSSPAEDRRRSESDTRSGTHPLQQQRACSP